MVQGPKKTISTMIPMELYEELNELVKDSSWSMSADIRQVLKAHLEYMVRFRRPQEPAAGAGRRGG